MGRRAAGWAYDIELCRRRLHEYDESGALFFRGMRGATGTQASFMELYEYVRVAAVLALTLMSDDAGEDPDEPPAELH